MKNVCSVRLHKCYASSLFNLLVAEQLRALCSGYFDWMTSKMTRLFLKEKFKMALCKAFVTLGSYPYQHGTDYHKKNTV
jgi:hypothetical protein